MHRRPHSSVHPVISQSKCLYLVFSCHSPLLHPVWPLCPFSAFLSVCSLSLFSFLYLTELTSTTCLSTTATLSAMRWLSFLRVKRSHHTSRTFHLKYSPRELIQFDTFHKTVVISSLTQQYVELDRENSVSRDLSRVENSTSKSICNAVSLPHDGAKSRNVLVILLIATFLVKN